MNPNRRLLILLACVMLSLLPLSAHSDFEINPSVNDAWVSTGIPGQGFFIMVFPELQLMFVAWFTYDTERPDPSVTALLGEPGHRWLTAFGSYQGDTATLNIELTQGGVFNSASPDPEQLPDGTMTIEFADCGNAMVTYQIDSIAQQGTLPLARAVQDNVPACQATQPEDSPVTVTFIGNMGVMISEGDKKVIIDGVVAGLGGWIAPQTADLQKVLNGTSPFDGIAFAGTTHGHGDHVSFSNVNTFFANQANARFIAATSSGVGVVTDQSRVQRADMVRGQSEKYSINGVDVTVFHTRHFNQFGMNFSDVTNLAYLVEMGGKKILHIGDFDYAADNIEVFGLEPGDLDAIIMPTFNTLISSTNFDLITNMLAPGVIIGAHFQAPLVDAERLNVLSLLPDAVIFDTPMETVVIE